jgi:hypothetical protein
MKMKTFLQLSLVGLMIACSPSTQISKTWTDPSWTQGSPAPFKKVLVVAPLKDEASRRIAEDKIVGSQRCNPTITLNLPIPPRANWTKR